MREGVRMRNTKAKLIYTVMPDYGGAYGWITEDDGTMTGCDEFIGLDSHPEISKNLSSLLAEWQSNFERNCNPFADGGGDFDWHSFHNRGLELSKLLKLELGDAVHLLYQKPFEDVVGRNEEIVEICEDGTLRVFYLHEGKPE